MNIQFVLAPSESKKLIARGVVEYLKPRLDDGASVLVTRGSTDGAVLEELQAALGISEKFSKADFLTGEIVAGTKRLWANKKESRKPEVLVEGTRARAITDAERVDIVRGMKRGDMIIKGANALDCNGTVGILVGDQTQGGTIGSLYGIARAKGIDIIVPVGLEKLVMHDIETTCQLSGATTCYWSQGMPVGMFPVAGAIVITEIEALELMFDVEVYHLASGGLGEMAGAVTLLVESDEDEELDACKAFLESSVFGEPALQPNPVD